MPKSERFKFTKSRLIELAPATGRSRYYVFDTVVRGFNLMITKTGHKSFYLNRCINRQTEHIYIGPFPDLPVEQARKLAEILAADIAQGKNPQETRRKRRKESTMGELMQTYLDRYAKKKKRTWKFDEQQFKRHLQPWAGRRISSVTHRQVEVLHNEVRDTSGLYSANRILSLLKILFNKAITWNLFDGRNPADDIEMFQETARDRYITAEEMPGFLKHLQAEPDQDFQDYVMLSLFTGLRQGNILGMKWSQVSFIAKTYSIPRTKNGKPYVADLIEDALGILKRRQEARQTEDDWVFPHPHKPGQRRPRFAYEWSNFTKKAGLVDLRMHDLRHTHASWLANSGADVAVIQKALGHRQIAQTMRYAHHTGAVVSKAQGIAVEQMLRDHSSDEEARPTPN